MPALAMQCLGSACSRCKQLKNQPRLIENVIKLIIFYMHTVCFVFL